MSILNEIRRQILDAADLDINEKMCLVALMCSDGGTDLDRLASYMGTTRTTASNAFESLQRKGYFAEAEEDEDLRKLRKYLQKSPKSAPSPIIKASEAPAAPPAGAGADVSADSIPESASVRAAERSPERSASGAKPSQTARRGNTRKASDTEAEHVDAVMALIDENLTRSEAAILLGFAGGDLKKIEGLYNRVRGTQVSDKIGALVNLLQSKDERTLNNKSKLLAYRQTDLKK